MFESLDNIRFVKKLALLLVIFTPLKFYGQVSSSNDIDSEPTPSHLFTKFGSAYEFILGYTEKSFWHKRQNYTALIFNGKTWELIEWTYELNRRDKPKKQQFKVYEVESSAAIELKLFWEEMKLSSISNDSLNWNKKDIGDGKILVQAITDGTIEQLEFKTPLVYKVLSAHEPERRQVFIYIEARNRFISFRNEFLKFSNRVTGN